MEELLQERSEHFKWDFPALDMQPISEFDQIDSQSDLLITRNLERVAIAPSDNLHITDDESI